MSPIEESKRIISTKDIKSVTDGLAGRRLKSQSRHIGPSALGLQWSLTLE